MIRILTTADRAANPGLFDQMFRARAAVFHDRLGWDVTVRDGWEIDHYDENEEPVYLVLMEEQKRLIGSLRLLPTTGPTMLCNEFADFFDEPVDVTSPSVWECTRFCVHPASHGDGAEKRRSVSAALLIGLCDLGLSSGVEQIVGLYENRMTKIYARIGWSPVPIAAARRSDLTVGVWDVSGEARRRMKDRLARQERPAAPGLAA